LLVGFSPHTPKLAVLIETQRNEETTHFRSGLAKLDEFLLGTMCAARMIGRLYEIPSHQRACPGCPYCRSKSRPPPDCETLEFPEAPSQKEAFRSELVENWPSPLGSVDRANFIEALSLCITMKGLRQFYCPLQDFELVLSCFKEAFPKNTPELHRLDFITQNSKLSSAASLPTIFFHIETVNLQALALGRNRPSVHLFCGVQDTRDKNGRDIAVNEQFRRWPSIESWISQLPESTLPCLPMTP
jgi:hypothetical protein